MTASSNRIARAAGIFSLVKTIAVVVWMVFTIRFVTLLLQALSRNRERFEFIQESTVPLLDTVSKIVVVGGAIYFTCLCWNIDVTAWLMSAAMYWMARPMRRCGDRLGPEACSSLPW